MSMKSLPWFRLYAAMVDDPNVRLLAYEDRWHYVALQCLKGQGVLDAGDQLGMLQRKVAVKLGLQLRELEAAAVRIAEVGLIDAETFQPLDWNRKQYVSDTDPTAAQRKRDQREKQRQANQRLAGVTDMSRVTSRVTVTDVTRTDTDTDTDTEETTTAPEELNFEAQALRDLDPVVVVNKLGSLETSVQQDVLDELAGRIEDGKADSPYGLLDSLVKAVKDKKFNLSRGRKVRDRRLAKAKPQRSRRPGESAESPYENAVNFVGQTYGPNAAEPNKTEFDRLIAEATKKWPAEAKTHSAATSSYRDLAARNQSEHDVSTTQGATS